MILTCSIGSEILLSVLIARTAMKNNMIRNLIVLKGKLKSHGVDITRVSGNVTFRAVFGRVCGEDQTIFASSNCSRLIGIR